AGDPVMNAMVTAENAKIAPGRPPMVDRMVHERVAEKTDHEGRDEDGCLGVPRRRCREPGLAEIARESGSLATQTLPSRHVDVTSPNTRCLRWRAAPHRCDRPHRKE